MTGLQNQLQQQDGFIREILAISNTPALSVGVLDRGHIIHTAHYGRREHRQNQPPDDDTIYRVASLTKSLTASTVALLVDEGKVAWDTPIREYLPAFAVRKDEIGLKSSLRDLLSNRTGLANGDAYWGQQHGEFLLPKEELVPIAANTPAVKPFGKRFVYAGWNYGLVTEIVEAVTGTTLGRFLDERFLKPLGMHRTTLADTEGRDNVALGYALASDGGHHQIEFQEMNDGIGLAGAYAGKSSIKDVLLMYKGLLHAQQDQAKSGLDKTPGSPFTHTKSMFEPHIEVFGPTNYCLGLYKTTLPGILGLASLNTVSYLGLKKSPIMGTTQEGLEVWHHTGNLPGFQASAFLVPKTQTAVVALTNSVAFMDPTDFVAQRLLAIAIGEKLNEELIPLAKAARASALSLYPKLQAKLLKDKTGKCSRPAEAYQGYYWNSAANFCLSILPQAGGCLLMKVQDVPRTNYCLQPYDGDTWWWPPNRDDELCNRGMFTNPDPSFHLISFSSTTGGQIDRLVWKHDFTAKPETFRRRNEKPRWKGYSRLKVNL